MKTSRVKQELSKIYNEMHSWPQINRNSRNLIPKDEVKKRELFLIGREELKKLVASKESKNQLAEELHRETYYLIKDTLKFY